MLNFSDTRVLVIVNVYYSSQLALSLQDLS